MTDEARRLDDLASTADYGGGVNRAMVRKSAEIFLDWAVPGSMLEMGPAEGLATAMLAERHPDLTCVEGSEALVAQLRERLPGIEVVASLFETYEPGRQFDTIVLGHVLEHVEDPVDIMRRAASWLAPGGRVIAATPNANSIHRQVGVELGIIEVETQLDASDLRVGHRRVFDLRSLRALVRDAGMTVVQTGGYWLKPLSNAQIEATWSDELIDVFMDLGGRYPEIAADIYVVARRP
jgi:2-polyprenyl-3-methyl-5-hydroxy-6-metoxy-1,4-benzoquinol methylase